MRLLILHISTWILIDLLCLTFTNVWFNKWVIWYLQISETYGRSAFSDPILAKLRNSSSHMKRTLRRKIVSRVNHFTILKRSLIQISQSTVYLQFTGDIGSHFQSNNGVIFIFRVEVSPCKTAQKEFLS